MVAENVNLKARLVEMESAWEQPILAIQGLTKTSSEKEKEVNA